MTNSPSWMETLEMEEFWQEYEEEMREKNIATISVEKEQELVACVDEKSGSIDYVASPPHYTKGSIEVIEAIEDWELGFHLGNVVKYVARAAHKGNKEQDLKKAQWYLARALERQGE